jgi:mono/diheme cytochrome c family protein
LMLRKPRFIASSPMKRVVAIVCLTVLGSACIGQPDEEATGAEMYLQLCSNCHGEDHQGGVGPALGPGSNAATRPEDYMRVSIVEGRGRMPSFSSTLTEQQIDRLVSHLLEVQGR